MAALAQLFGLFSRRKPPAESSQKSNQRVFGLEQAQIRCEAHWMSDFKEGRLFMILL